MSGRDLPAAGELGAEPELEAVYVRLVFESLMRVLQQLPPERRLVYVTANLTVSASLMEQVQGPAYTRTVLEAAIACIPEPTMRPAGHKLH